MSIILQKLRGGDRRSIGRVPEVVAEVLRAPDLFGELFEGMLSDDPLVRMRAADAAEKVSRHRPELLQPLKRQLLRQVAANQQQEVRWHVAQMAPRIRWTPSERARLVEILFGYLEDRSKIVKTFAMQALADLAIENPQLRPRVVAMLEEQTHSGSPALKSRRRKLLNTLTALPPEVDDGRNEPQ